MKKYSVYIVSFILALICTFYISNLFKFKDVLISAKNSSIIEQKIIAYSKESKLYHKIYKEGKLLAIMSDKEKVDRFLVEHYNKNYKEKFPNSKLNYGIEYYIESEYNFYQIENVDDKIINYLKDNNDFSILTNEISFSNENGVFAKIYVDDIADFETAKKRFLLNFVNEESLERFESGSTTDELTTYGRRDISLEIKDKAIINKAYAPVDKVMLSVEEIFEYLCYGENKEKKYYVVQEGDTLEGVSFKHNNISTRLLVLINPNILTRTNQILEPGTILNVTYFTSPLTVQVKKENMINEPIYALNPHYIEDSEVIVGTQVIESESENGYQNVLYEEVYINGVLQPSLTVKKSVKRIKEPIQAVIRVGSKIVPSIGTGDYIWPIDNPVVSCLWMCYFNHRGLDLINIYNPYGNIYAIDNGIVVKNEYAGDWGYMVTIDHQNGYQTSYAHMNQLSNLEVGQIVQKGDIIGMIGNTGYSFGVHLHLEFWKEGERIDPCTILACDTLQSNQY